MLAVVECPTCHSRSYELQCGVYFTYTGVLKARDKELLRRQVRMTNEILITNYTCPKCEGRKKSPDGSICGTCEGAGQLPKVKSFDNEVKVKDSAKFVG